MGRQTTIETSPHPQKLVGLMNETSVHPTVDDGIHLRMELKVMSVGDEGTRWLNEHAPGWQNHVGQLIFNVDRNVSRGEIVKASEASLLLHLLRGEMIRMLATQMVEQMEPGVREVRNGPE